MDGLPEVLLTDESIYIVKYAIESISYKNRPLNKSFFRAKIGDTYHDVSEGTASFRKLRDLLLTESTEGLWELKG